MHAWWSGLTRTFALSRWYSDIWASAKAHDTQARVAWSYGKALERCMMRVAESAGSDELKGRRPLASGAITGAWGERGKWTLDKIEKGTRAYIFWNLKKRQPSLAFPQSRARDRAGAARESSSDMVTGYFVS